MKTSFRNFVWHLVIFSLIVSLIGALLFYLAPGEYYTQAFPFLIVFFFVVTLIVHYFLEKAIKNRPMKFVNLFMLITFLKLFFFLVIMVIYALLAKEDAIRFIITYLALYILFSAFEVVSILKDLKKA